MPVAAVFVRRGRRMKGPSGRHQYRVVRRWVCRRCGRTAETSGRVTQLACPAGPAADFFKGLIQLAVAGVKVREGREDGVRTHARRAAELFAALSRTNPAPWGLDLSALAVQAGIIAERPPSAAGEDRPSVERVLDVWLCPGERLLSSAGAEPSTRGADFDEPPPPPRCDPPAPRR